MKRIMIIFIFAFIFIFSGCTNSRELKKSAIYLTADIESTNYRKVLGSPNKEVKLNDAFLSSLTDFSYLTSSKLLMNKNGTYSPISLYIALSMLAEVAAGTTREEIIDVLGVNSIDVLRSGNEDLFKKIAYRNSISTLSLGNSIWLKKGGVYKDEPLQTLAERYHASSFGVDFTLDNTKKIISAWISQNTGDKLSLNDNFKLDPRTIFMIINTLYFIDKWQVEFDGKLNVNEDFHSGSASKKVEYMKGSFEERYFEGIAYQASTLGYKNGGKIVFVLPKPGVGVEEIISNQSLLKEAISLSKTEGYLINYQIPKFKFKSEFNLLDFVRELGIETALSMGADFSTLTDTGIYISTIVQNTFIDVNEKGTEAAAYTKIIGVEKAAPPEKEVDMILNRPFIFAIKVSNIPIFIGVVNDPSDNGIFNYS